jgi:hypothetical protein
LDQSGREERDTMTTTDLGLAELMPNNAITNDPCAYCGQRTDPCGWDVQTPYRELVCDDCAEKVAPGEAALGRAIAALDGALLLFDDDDRYRLTAVVGQWVRARRGTPEDRRRDARARTLRAAAVAAGHDPTPSYMFSWLDTSTDRDVERFVASLGNVPGGTCYDGCVGPDLPAYA